MAVVITLLYLASQTKQNTQATRAHATASVASEMEQALLTMAQDDLLARAYAKAARGEELAEQEAIRLGFWWAAFVRSAHSHLVQDGMGNLSEDNEMAISQILGSFMQVPFLRSRLKQLIETGQYPADFCRWAAERVLAKAATDEGAAARFPSK